MLLGSFPDPPGAMPGALEGLQGHHPKSWSNEKMFLTKIVRNALVMKKITTTPRFDPRHSPEYSSIDKTKMNLIERDLENLNHETFLTSMVTIQQMNF